MFVLLVEGYLKIRIDYGPGYRLYFVFIRQERALFLIGGNKKTQQQDIKDAKHGKGDI